MTENKKINSEILKTNIEDKKLETLDEIDRKLANINIAITSKERGESMVNELSKIGKHEAQARAKEILERQKGEINEAERGELLHEYDEKMAALLKRLQVVISVGANDFAGLDHTLALFRATETEQAGKVPVDYINIFDKLHTGKGNELSDSEWGVVEGVMRKLATLGAVDPKEAARETNKYTGFVILSELSPEQRFKVLEHMENDPSYPSLLMKLVATNYLTIAQGIKLSKNIDPKQRAVLLADMDSDGMRRYQQDIAKLQGAAQEVYERNYAQNYAGKYLNPGTYLTVKAGQTLGVLTVVTNFFANVNPANLWKDPGKFAEELGTLATNPAFLLGVGVTAGTVEYVSGGIGKGWISRSLQYIVKDKSLDADKKEKAKIEQMGKIFGNYPAVAEFYFKHANQIEDLKKQHKAVTLDALEYSPEEIYGSSKQTFIDNIPQFAEILSSDDEKGFHLKTAGEQRIFINKAMKAQGLEAFKV